ncbi:tetratricopeptide repeat protein [bacterium]|nr:tetratricopeptide repeat protein [bacterium]
MYLKLIILAFLSIFIEANNEITTNNIVKAQEEQYTQSIENSNDYITASVMYKIKDYQKSYELFFKLFTIDSYNINVNYFLALSAIQINKNDEAMAAFERILTQKPDFNQARYEYAKLLFKLNLKNDAKKEFMILSKSDINNNTKKSVDNYLDAINKESKYFYANASILVGVGRSTNVNSGLDSPEYRLSGLNNISVSGEKPIADNYHNEMLMLNFSNNFKDSSYTLKNSIFIYNKNYFHENMENLTAYSYKPTILYFDQKTKNIYSLNFGFTRIDKKDNENFNIFNLTPSFSNSSILSSLNYQRILYLDESDKDKNFDKYEFLLKYNLLTTLNIYSKFSKSVRIDTTRIDLDKNSILTGMEYVYQINNKNLIKFDLEYMKSYYKYTNNYFDSKREDNYYFVGLSYLTKINKENQIMLSTSFTKNNSNQGAYPYEEIDGKINYIKTFNW